MSARRGPYAIDFHVHTSYSFDSLTPPKVVLEMARRRGLDGVAIVDHDTIEGALATMRANKREDFLVIPGIEVKSDRGDIIGLYLSRDIKSRVFAEVIDEIHAQGGIAYVPHPVRTFGAENLPALRAEHPDIELWELFNGRYGKREFREAEAMFAEMQIQGPLCGSDAHHFWEVGIFRTLLPELPRDPQTLLALSKQATLDAAVRSDFELRAGIRMGELTKTYKRRQYGKLGTLIASMPWKLARRTAKAAFNRARGS